MYEHCQREGERGRGRKRKRERESRQKRRAAVKRKKGKFRSGEFGKFRRSQWHFNGDTPITGLFEPGQARKTAGHNTAGEFNREADNNSHPVCLSRV